MTRGSPTPRNKDDITPEEEVRLTRYLLGELEEHEHSELESGYFADDARFERLLSVENDLIDAYVRGELSEQHRRAFDARLAVSADLRRRVELAQGLQRYVQKVEAPGRASVGSRLDWWRRWQWPVAAAALLVIAVGVWWARPRSGAQPPAPSQQTQSQPSLTPAVPEQPRQAAPPQPQPREVVVAFTLTPGLARAPGETNTLQIPANATQVRLRLEHEGTYPRYRAVLRTVDGREVWRQADVGAAGSSIAVVTIPAAAVSTDDYILTLSGANRGSYEEVAEFVLRVRR